MRDMPGHAFVAAAVFAGACIFGGPLISAEQAPTAVEQRVAALKQSIAESQARLRKYEWIETTIISLKGEEKDRKQQRCYYGVDGTLQKVLLSDEKAAPPGGGRLKRKIVANKTAGMKEYMESASNLIHRYVPPNPTDIDSAKKREKVALRPGQGGRVRLEFTDYLQPGDLMTVDVDPAANALLSVGVNTYLDKPEEAVTLTVGFAALPDGASYNPQITLDAKAKKITVVIQNSGHRPVSQ
jgi:hypothetical protein